MNAPTSNDPFNAAVEWMVKDPPETRMRASVPILKDLFGLDPKQAIDAIRRANEIRYGIGGTP